MHICNYFSLKENHDTNHNNRYRAHLLPAEFLLKNHEGKKWYEQIT